MTSLGSVETAEQRPAAESDDLEEQPARDAPPRARKPREPLSARAIALIVTPVIAALITVGGMAAIAAFNALRDDIKDLRTAMVAGDESLRAAMVAGDESLRAEIGSFRAETREQFAEVHAVLRGHTERLTRVETQLQDHTERLTRVETQLQDHTDRLIRLEARQQGNTDRLVRLEAGQHDHTDRLARLEAGQMR